jgi:hypothetical protein
MNRNGGKTMPEVEKMSEHIVHIEWEGPLTISEVANLNQSTDYGIYAVYGYHPVYGSNALLYIGKVQKQTFGQRFRKEGLGWQQGSLEDTAHTEVYVGRMKGPDTPPEPIWEKDIDLAEKLLIHAHGPAYNSQQIGEVCETDPEVCNTRVLNWGCHRAIRPEVSGLRWTKIATDKAKAFKIYGS